MQSFSLSVQYQHKNFLLDQFKEWVKSFLQTTLFWGSHFVAIAICSRISALYEFLGNLIGVSVAVLAGNSIEAIENEIFGFNSSLTFTSIIMFYVTSCGSCLVGIMASTVTVFLQVACKKVMQPYRHFHFVSLLYHLF